MNADAPQRARVDADLAVPPPGALRFSSGADDMAIFNEALRGLST